MEKNTVSHLDYSELESKRFGMKIYRGIFDEINEKDILSIILKENVDIAIFRIPSGKQFQIYRLEKTGFPYLVTDSLVVYDTVLTKIVPNDLRNNDLEFIECQTSHLDILNSLVSKIFIGYTNHYFSNPYLNKDSIMEGYKEWVRNYISKENNGRICWLVKKSGQIVGFATCKFGGNECEGVLYGVLPEASGKGIYSDLIRFTQNYFKNKGFLKMIVSTQIQNKSVQKVWIRENFLLSNSYITLHINSLLSYSKNKTNSIKVVISKEDIESYGEISGDRNPVHFDIEFAKSIGFSDRIAHGIIATGLISKYAGNVYPGYGTLFLGYNYKFFQPLYINKTYNFIYSNPVINEEKGFYKCVVKVLDSENQLCILAYLDLFKKVN